MRLRSVVRTLFIGLLTWGSYGAPALAQTPKMRLSGNVTDTIGKPVTSAVITLTATGSAQSERYQADSTGKYEIAVPGTVTEFLIHVGAIGFKSERRRLSRVAHAENMRADFKLIADVATLAAVNVRAHLARPEPSFGRQPSAGTDGGDRTVDGVHAAAHPDQAASTVAQAELIPGLQVGPAGVTALGVSSDQNQTTLNGLMFSGTVIPRSARTSMRYTTSTWDPSIGGFAGVRSSLFVGRGSDVTERSTRLNRDFDVGSSNPYGTLRPSFSSFDIGGAGPIALESKYYNYGVRFTRAASDAPSFLSASETLLHSIGVSADSVRELQRALRTLGIPTNGPNSRTSIGLSSLLRIDIAGRNGADDIPKSSWSFVGYANADRNTGIGLSPSTAPSASALRHSGQLFLQATHSRYMGERGSILNEASGSVSLDRAEQIPTSRLPNGRVQIFSSGLDSLPTFSALAFGGTGSLDSRNQTFVWEVANRLSILLRGDETLPLKLHFQSRVETFSDGRRDDEGGSFEYPSIAALVRNEPSAYFTTISPKKAVGGRWFGGASLGAEMIKPKMRILGGARLDVQQSFGELHQDAATNPLAGPEGKKLPKDLSISPRLGFNWYYKGRTGTSSSGSPLWLINRGGPQFRGGVGLFVGAVSLATLKSQLASGSLNVNCVGLAVPQPRWDGSANDGAPLGQCGGTGAQSGSFPSFSSFANNYRPSRSLRSSLGWTGRIRDHYLALDATHSWNLHQPSVRDINLRDLPVFELRNEQGRPVYSRPNGIDSVSGAVALSASRRDARAGRILEWGSTSKGVADAITVYSIPTIPAWAGLVTLGYTFSSSKAQSSGFNRTTSGNPRLFERGADGFTPRHTVIVQSAKIFKSVGVTAALRVQSGLPFSPLISGDANGDGLFNDRAFVFDPRTTESTEISRGIKTLLDDKSTVSRCLADQLGQIAAQNSCGGPWSFSNSLSLVFLSALPKTSDRANVSLYFSNPVGGVDYLIHGARRLRGWGSPDTRDPVLLRITGFDPNAMEFRYSVNSRFGKPAPKRNSFQLTLEVRVGLAPSYMAQRLALDLREKPALVGTKASEDVLKKRLQKRNFTDLYGVLIAHADSIALSRDQIEQMQVRRSAMLHLADSLFGSLASKLTAMPPQYDAKEVLQWVDQTASAGWQAIYGEKPFLNSLLSPGQKRLLPSDIYAMLTVDGFSRRFYFGGY